MNRNVVLAAAMVIALGSAISSAADAEEINTFKVENAPGVMVLSEASAETAWALFSAGAPEVSAKRPVLDARTIVYVDVNSIDLEPRDLEILGAARRGGNTIIFESANWSVDELHALVGQVFSDVRLFGLQNVALAIVSDKNGSRAIDLTPSKASMMIGVPFFETEEGRSQIAGSENRAPIHWLAPFASSAYQTNPSHAGYTRFVNQDVLKIWKTPAGSSRSCVVAFRGSVSVGDWLRNGESQFGLSEIPYPTYFGTARIGHGYRSRLDNLWDTIYEFTRDCPQGISVTGHSLGGGMAEAGAYRLGMSTERRVSTMAAFNPARVGNAAFRTQLQNNVTTLKVFCRHGDPVWYVPMGLQHVGDGEDGCTDWGARASWLNLVANHDMSHWL